MALNPRAWRVAAVARGVADLMDDAAQRKEDLGSKAARGEGSLGLRF